MFLMSNFLGIDNIADNVISFVKDIALKSCVGIGEFCIIVCGMSIIWFMINNDSKIAKEGFTGSIVVYIGTKLVEIWLN